MKSASSIRYWLFLVLSAIGLITAWVFNGIAVMNGEDYGAAWTGNAVDWVLTADLSIVAIAAVIFMFAEAQRLGMKRVWVYVLLSIITAMAFTFPLFLAMRERAISGQPR